VHIAAQTAMLQLPYNYACMNLSQDNGPQGWLWVLAIILLIIILMKETLIAIEPCHGAPVP